MTGNTATTPLIALDAVAVDTETTGLDTATARIVQIGAVAISKGRVRRNQTLNLCVNPQTAIPLQATRIHGIDDAMVHASPAFADIWPRLDRFRKNRVLVGYATGFDLAVLEAEIQRAGASWHPPATLCVRLLTQVVNAALPDYSLEAIAAWLGVSISNRHQALGDALAAADIFVALLPKLHACGVRTLGQAERVCHQLDGSRAQPPARSALAGGRPMGHLDPYAYSHHIRDVMTASPLVIAPTQPVLAAVDLMAARRVSALLVSYQQAPGGAVGSYGIVTESDIMRALAGQGVAGLQGPVDAIASRPLISVRAQAFVYRAIGRMDRLKIRHLAVRDEAGLLVGIVSARDLLKLRATAAIHLDDALEAASSPAEMAAAWATLPGVADRLIAEQIDARLVSEIVSEELHSVIRRAAALAQTEMERLGHGPPPCRFALLVLGSGGRRESLLASDQDNAIVFEDGDPGGAEDSWFSQYGGLVADYLDAVGIPYCKGGVMASRPAWRGSMQQWRSRIASWVRRSRPEDMLNIDIFFDQRPAFGDAGLAAQLFDHAFAAAHGQVEFAKLLGEQTSRIATPFTVFGRFNTEYGRVDLKRHGLFPIVAMARTLAIRHDIRMRSTRGRLERLIALEIGSQADLARLLAGHKLILSLLLAQQSLDLHAGLPASNKVDITRLDRIRVAELKTALRHLQLIPELVRTLMFPAHRGQ